MSAKTQKTPLLKEGQYTVEDVSDWNFFDISGVNAGTKGYSNKQYHMELHVGKNGQAQIFTMFGATGARQTENWRYFDSVAQARKELESMKKKRLKKNYKEIKVAIRACGSEAAKKITTAVELKNADHLKPTQTSKLHKETQKLMRTLFGATEQFVVTTLRCPLGQLSNSQIDEGQARLDAAKKIINKNHVTKDDLVRIEELTNEFYAIIPHNLGSGSRGQRSDLLLDSPQKVAQKEYDLETLMDAKSVGAVLGKGSSVDDQYTTLNTDITFVDHESLLFSWINKIVLDTRAHNHNTLGKITVLNAWEYNRHGERAVFEKRMKQITNECGKSHIPKCLYESVTTRKDIPNGLGSYYKHANVLPLFHGTRTQNISGITKSGMLIRPSGAVLTGAMYGNSLYMALNSTKSINYTNIRSSYYAKGKDDKAFLFIVDCVLGNFIVPKGAYPYTKQNIKPNHSVYAKGGISGVINDEIMLYDTNQHYVRYLVEFTCHKNKY